MTDRVIGKESLREFGRTCFVSAGLEEDAADVVARDLVAAELRGLASHGVSRIPMYVDRIEKNVVNPRPKIGVESRGAAAILIDGDDGMGFLVAHRGIEEGIKVAEKTGLCMVGVRRSTHFGMSALYVRQALEAGYNSLVFTNSSPAIAAWGGRTPFLGAAPLAAGLVGGLHSPPYLLDMAMTVIARGKIRVAMTRGEPIAEGLALDSEGAPTTDARKAFEGVCLPFGGVKGSALSMLMDLMAGLFTGANFGGDVKSLYYDHSAPQNVGHLFMLMRPDLFMPLQLYRERMDIFHDRLKALPRAKGVEEILMPGELETKIEKRREAEGIPVNGKILDELAELARRLGLDLPDFLY